MAAGKADGAGRPGGRRPPLYARLLRLRRLRPGPVLCFIFLEGSIAFGVLLALANLASWWTVLALPVAVAVMVKLNDVVAAATAKAPRRRPKPAAKRDAVEAEKAEQEPEKPEKPEWPLPGNPSKPLLEDEPEEPAAAADEDEAAPEDDEAAPEEDTEKTGSPTATRSSSG